MTRFLIVLITLAFAGGPAALAFDGNGSSRNGNRIQAGFTINNAEDDAEEAENLGADDNPRAVILPAIVSPLISDNRLRGYAYLQVRMMVREGVDAWRIREQAHYALDAMIRASHRESITSADGLGIDREVANRVWMAALTEQFGTNVIESLVISTPDTRLLRR